MSFSVDGILSNIECLYRRHVVFQYRPSIHYRVKLPPDSLFSSIPIPEDTQEIGQQASIKMQSTIPPTRSLTSPWTRNRRRTRLGAASCWCCDSASRLTFYFAFSSRTVASQRRHLVASYPSVRTRSRSIAGEELGRGYARYRRI